MHSPTGADVSEPQGYYAAVTERIPLTELPARCEIKEA
jgi:hypothetical protein